VNGAVSGVNALTLDNGTNLTAGSVTVGSETLGGNVTTSGSQTVNGAVTQNTASTLTAGGSISVAGPVTGSKDLTAKSTGGAVTFGNTVNVGNLNVSAVNGINLAGNVTSTGSQTYNGDITVASALNKLTLDAGSTLNTTGAFRTSPDMQLTLKSGGAMSVDASNLSPVSTLDITSGGNVDLRNASLDNNGTGVIATSGITVTKPVAASLNSATDLLKIAPQTPSILILDPGSLQIPADQSTYFLSGNVNANSALFQQSFFLSFAFGGIDSQVDEFIRTALRQDAGVLPVENQVLLGNTPIADVVAPLTYPSLQIRMPDCVEEQRKGEPCHR
jgi:hypothetical protein